MRIARTTYRLVYWGGAAALLLLVGVAALIGQVTGTQELRDVLVFPFALWLIFGRRLAFWLVPLFLSRIRCPGCGEEHEPRGIWHCGCGYRDHRETNILAHKCPACGEYKGRFNCPTCEATILLW